MKAWTIASLLLAASAKAHSIYQRVSINGADQGYLVGVRAPSTNNPVTDVTSSSITCNTGLVTPVSTAVVNIPAGAQVGAYWQHVLGGAQYSGDPDNPIATSHHGPIQVYLAKVSDASSSGTTGLQWFKIASDGLNNGKWGVDNMVANNGWAYFTLPSCIAPGNYLMRVELLALHNAYSSGGAQFYMSCTNINVTGSGTFTPSSTVSFPGAYSASDPGILINIYDSSGNPTNGGKAYTPPGPAVISCSGSVNSTPASSSSKSTSISSSSKSTSTSSSRTSSTSSSKTSSTTSSGGAALYGQCGGQGWTGPTTCAQGTCTYSNPYYSQCLP